MTEIKLSNVRVKRKGQVTIPIELRSRLGIEEGSLLEIEEEKGTILMRPVGRMKGGKVVGKKEYKQIIDELADLRRSWR